MLLLLLVLTVSCVTVSLVVAVLAFLDPVKSLSKWLLIAALISVTGLYIDALPAGISLPDHHELPFEFVSIFSTGLIWASILTMTWYAISTLLILHVLWVALRGYRTDLLGARRNMRLCIAVLPVIAIAANLMADFTLGDVEQRLFRVVFALPLTLMVMFWLLKFESAELNFETRIERNQSGVDPKDAAAHKRLIAIMEQEQAYLEPELSITGLSERVGIPQHQ